MTAVDYNPALDKYFVAQQSGPAGMGYGNYTTETVYGGNCFLDCNTPHGPQWIHTDVRERMRCMYDDGVQGGSPLAKSLRTDAQTESGLKPPFQTYAVNYFGDIDPYRKRPYGEGFSNPANTKYGSSALKEAFGHYYDAREKHVAFPCQDGTYIQPLMTMPVPGVPEAKTLETMAWVDRFSKPRS